MNQATAWNATLDITGKLLYCEGTFIQLLEGHERAVRLVYQSIIKDSRLIAVKKVAEGVAEKRYFDTWSMGYARVSLNEINEFENCAYKNVTDYLNSAPTLKLLKLLAVKN